jgi:RNA recognition motif-containing protein
MLSCIYALDLIKLIIYYIIFSYLNLTYLPYLVQFSSVEEARRAISTLNDTDHMGLILRCREAQPAVPMPPPPPCAAKPTAAYVTKPAYGNKPVNKPVHAQATTASNAVPTHGSFPSDGKKIKASAKTPQAAIEPKPNPFKCCASNFPFEVTNEELHEYFSTIGVVKSAEINYTKRGRNVGTAIIEYEDSACVHMAIGQLNDSYLMGRELKVKECFTK